MHAAPYGTSVQGFRDSAGPGRLTGGVDVPLLVAAVGLMGCSLYTITQATQTDIPGTPTTSSSARLPTAPSGWCSCS
ncbi:MAG: hypothetical protein WKF40_10025 [Thermoleophilaceae bacterium]